jgi:hypothetical protein
MLIALAWTLVFAVVVMIAVAFTTPPVRVADVRNGELRLRHYYDYRKTANVLTYFAEMADGKPTGRLYAVELASDKSQSRNPIVQFSDAGASDKNPGTLIETVPRDSAVALGYHVGFEDVRAKYENQKWHERIPYP